MKKAYLTIIWSIAIVCIVAGTLYHVGNFASGFSFMGHGPFARVANSGNNTVVSDAMELDILSREAALEIDGDLMDFTIQKGDSWNVEYECTEYLEPEIKVDEKANGKTQITITQPNASKYIGNNFNNVNCKLTLTMPADASISDCNVYLDLGDMDIYGVTADAVDVQMDLGDMDIDNCDFNKLTIVSDLGDVTIQNSKIDSGDIEADLGNTDVLNCDFKDMKVVADLGDVDIDSKSNLDEYTIDAEVDMGELKLNNSKYGEEYHQNGKAGTLIIDASMGDAVITW